MLLDLVMSHLRLVYLVIQHPSDCRLGHEEPRKDQQIDVKRNKSTQVL
jgi:hypothetical protein